MKKLDKKKNEITSHKLKAQMRGEKKSRCKGKKEEKEGSTDDMKTDHMFVSSFEQKHQTFVLIKKQVKESKPMPD